MNAWYLAHALLLSYRPTHQAQQGLLPLSFALRNKN